MRHILTALGVALAYLVIGRLSLLLAIPPGFASPVWPAAGVALAAVLFYGYRVLPGVLLGSLAVNILAGLAGGAPSVLDAAPTAFGISVGATLQAGIAAAVLNWLLPSAKWKLENAREIALLVLIGGPVSSLINALIGPLVLQSAGLVTEDAFGVNVFTWWVGDAIGSISTAPVVLLLAARGDVSRARKAAVIGPMTVIFVAAIFAFSMTRHYGMQSTRAEFERLAGTHELTLEKHLQDLDRILASMNGLFASRDEVSRDEFRRFTDEAFRGFVGIQALEWVPRVAAADLERYEAQAHADGLTDFRFKHIENGEIQPPLDLPEYFPVYFVEPMAGNEAALGLVSSTSAPGRQATIDRARDEARTIAAEPVRLVQETGAQAGLLLFSPVYRGGGIPETLAERRERLVGVTEGVIRVGDFIESVLPDMGGTYELHIRDRRAGIERWDVMGTPASPGALAVTTTMFVGGREWIVTQTPTAAFLTDRRDWTSWIVLTAGLLLVSLLGLLLLQMTARADIISRLVDERTERLRSITRQLGLVLDNAGDGILSADMSGRSIVVSASAARLLGYEPAELEGVQLADLMRPVSEDGSGTDPEASIMHPLALPVGGERGRFRRKDGNEFIAEYSSEPIRDEDGEPSGVVVVFRDITRRIEAEKALRRATQATDRALRDLAVQEERYRSLVDNVPGIVYRCDLDEHWTMRYMSEFVEELTGYPATDFIDNTVRSYASVIHPEDADDVAAGVEAGIAASGFFLLQYRIIHRDGSIRWVFERGQAMRDTKGVVDYLDGFILDITERQLAEDERDRLITDLSNANEELERFAHVASHDLKEPLRVVAGFTRLLRGRHSDQLDTQGRDYLDNIAKASERMQALISDLLTYARLGAEADEGFERVALDNVMADVRENLSDAIEESGATLNVSALPELRGNPIQLMRLLQNLVGNAIKFHAHDVAPVIEVKARERGDKWQVSVADNGIGIAPEQRDLVFSPLKRLHSQAEYAGTGMGLAICRKIVESHGGTLEVAENEPTGTVFIATLPKPE